MDIFNLPIYRFYLIADYQPNESLIFKVCQHCGVDGVSYFSLLTAISDQRDFKSLPRVSPPTFMQRVVAELISPFAAVQQAFYSASLKT